jgi:thymidylate synthase (FAD)
MNDHTINVLDHGYVRLLNPDELDERLPANSARVSFDAADTRAHEQDMKLTRYLWQHRHTTPFEMLVTRWEMKMPIFVARQLVRHRTASINEVSRRYVDGPVEFYTPEVWRGRSEDKKQGSAGNADDQEWVSVWFRESIEHARAAYETMIKRGVCPEQARAVLPLSTYTKWVWAQDFHNLMHMLRLRSAEDAQWETRQFADAMLLLLRRVLPDLMAVVEGA